MYSTPKLSKYVALLLYTYKAIQWVLNDLYSSTFVTYAPSFTLVAHVFTAGKLCLE